MLSISSETKNGVVYLRLVGPINERAGKPLADAMPPPERPTVLDFAGVDRINSLGIKVWINFFRQLIDGRKVTFINYPTEMVEQSNLIPAISRGAEIQSFQVRFYCTKCQHEQERLFSALQPKDELQSQLESQACEACQGPAECEANAEDLLAFLGKAA